MITIKKDLLISDISENDSIIVNKKISKGFLIFTEENNGFFSKKNRTNIKNMNIILKEFILEILKEKEVYYYVRGLNFNYRDLNNVITSKESFFKSDCLLSKILEIADVEKAVKIWTDSCNENRTFIIVRKNTNFNNQKDLFNEAEFIITTCPDYFGYGFFVTYNVDYYIDELLSILRKNNKLFSVLS